MKNLFENSHSVRFYLSIAWPIFLTLLGGASAQGFVSSTAGSQLVETAAGSAVLNPSAVTPLAITLNPDTTVITNSAGTTCNQSTVLPRRISLGQVAIQWTGAAPLENSAIVIALQSSHIKSGQYICTVDSKEFDAVFGTHGATVVQSVNSISTCDLQCGGIKLVDTTTGFHATGTVTIFGVTQLGTLGRVQEHATIAVSIDFLP